MYKMKKCKVCGVLMDKNLTATDSSKRDYDMMRGRDILLHKHIDYQVKIVQIGPETSSYFIVFFIYDREIMWKHDIKLPNALHFSVYFSPDDTYFAVMSYSETTLQYLIFDVLTGKIMNAHYASKEGVLENSLLEPSWKNDSCAILIMDNTMEGNDKNGNCELYVPIEVVARNTETNYVLKPKREYAWYEFSHRPDDELCTSMRVVISDDNEDSPEDKMKEMQGIIEDMVTNGLLGEKNQQRECVYYDDIKGVVYSIPIRRDFYDEIQIDQEQDYYPASYIVYFTDLKKLCALNVILHKKYDMKETLREIKETYNKYRVFFRGNDFFLSSNENESRLVEEEQKIVQLIRDIEYMIFSVTRLFDETRKLSVGQTNSWEQLVGKGNKEEFVFFSQNFLEKKPTRSELVEKIFFDMQKYLLEYCHFETRDLIGKAIREQFRTEKNFKGEDVFTWPDERNSKFEFEIRKFIQLRILARCRRDGSMDISRQKHISEMKYVSDNLLIHLYTHVFDVVINHFIPLIMMVQYPTQTFQYSDKMKLILENMMKTPESDSDETSTDPPTKIISRWVELGRVYDRLMERFRKSERRFIRTKDGTNTINLYRVGKNQDVSLYKTNQDKMTFHNYRLRSFTSSASTLIFYVENRLDVFRRNERRLGVPKEKEDIIIYHLELNVGDNGSYCPEWIIPIDEPMDYGEDEWVVLPGKIFEIKSIQKGFPETIRQECEKEIMLRISDLGESDSNIYNKLKSVVIYTINIGIHDENKNRSMQMNGDFISSLD